MQLESAIALRGEISPEVKAFAKAGSFAALSGSRAGKRPKYRQAPKCSNRVKTMNQLRKIPEITIQITIYLTNYH